MIRLYGCYRSRATRPLWALFETELAFEHAPTIQAYRLTDPKASDAPDNTASPDFLKINPMGQIPVLVDGDLVLTESLAITLNIARRAGGPLAPASDAETALMEQWALFAMSSVETPALEIAFALMGPDAASPETQATIAISAEKLRRPFARLEAFLADREWLVGERFTAADIMTAECVRYAQGHSAVFEEFPSVKTWLARCQARPAFQKVWAGRMAEPA